MATPFPTSHRVGAYLKDLTMFAFSSLFAAAQVIAGFDASIAHDAEAGRVNFAFASLASSVLPLVKADGNPIGKAQLLKLAATYRSNKGAGYAKGYKQVRQWGAALDAIAAAMGDAGALTVDQWADLVPAPKKAASKPKPAAVVAGAGSGATDVESAGSADAITPASTPDVNGAVNLILAALKAGMMDSAQARTLAAALAVAGYTVEPATV